jgi:hypothetical protein
MSKEKLMCWVPFTGDSTQRVPIRLEKEFATIPRGIGLVAWLRDCTERLAAEKLRLVRIAKRDPRALKVGHRIIEQCLPDFWQSPHHEDLYRQILEREQDEEWHYALISTSATAETKEAGSQESDPALQRGWCPLSECLRYVAAASGKPEDAWPEVKNAISDGELRARGTYFEIDHQPLQPEWMRIVMWDDANDDAIFFREEKGSDLVPPQRVPGHITNVEVCTADIERRWRSNAKEAAMSSLADMELIAVAGAKPAPRSIDGARRGTRGPKRGSLDRYGEADRSLFPKIEEIMKTEKLSAHAVAHRLAENGKVAGTGTPKSRAKRLAALYLQFQQKNSLKLAETFGNFPSRLRRLKFEVSHTCSQSCGKRMSLSSPKVDGNEVVPASHRSRAPSPNLPIQYAPMPDWFRISGMRRTATYEALGRGDLRAIKLNGRTLIDVPHGLAYLAQLPEAVITTGTRLHNRGGRPPKSRNAAPACEPISARGGEE